MVAAPGLVHPLEPPPARGDGSNLSPVAGPARLSVPDPGTSVLALLSSGVYTLYVLLRLLLGDRSTGFETAPADRGRGAAAVAILFLAYNLRVFQRDAALAREDADTSPGPRYSSHDPRWSGRAGVGTGRRQRRDAVDRAAVSPAPTLRSFSSASNRQGPHRGRPSASPPSPPPKHARCWTAPPDRERPGYGVSSRGVSFWCGMRSRSSSASHRASAAAASVGVHS